MPSCLSNGLALPLPRLSPSSPSCNIPAFLYGTAGKKDQTDTLVLQALHSGFTAFDTAAQPRHYQEHLVGSALRKAVAQQVLKRDDIFIQTKFTPIDGQDANRAPYDPSASIPDQVRPSVNSSLRNLHVGGGDSDTDKANESSHIDCLLLHSPLDTLADTLSAWDALEAFVPHTIRHLGISNINLNNLSIIYELVHIKPSVVQNRFHGRNNFDREVRRFCEAKGMVYQSYWTLTANAELLGSEPVGKAAGYVGVGREAALYCLMLGLKNVVVLDGTTKQGRMREDVDAVRKCADWVAEDKNQGLWDEVMEVFRGLIGDKDD